MILSVGSFCSRVSQGLGSHQKLIWNPIDDCGWTPAYIPSLLFSMSVLVVTSLTCDYSTHSCSCDHHQLAWPSAGREWTSAFDQSGIPMDCTPFIMWLHETSKNTNLRGGGGGRLCLTTQICPIQDTNGCESDALNTMLCLSHWSSIKTAWLTSNVTTKKMLHVPCIKHLILSVDC